FSLH
ncbi:unnamed protein product, partial [Allacma fusca]